MFANIHSRVSLTEGGHSEASPIGDRLQQLLASGLMSDSGRKGWPRHLRATALVAIITSLGALLGLRSAPTNLAMLYLLGAVFVSYRWGFIPALTYSILSTFTFDFFFIPPYESFAVTDFWYFLTAITLMGVSLFISILTTVVRQQAVAAGRRESALAIKRSVLREKALAAEREQQRALRAKAEAIATLAGGLAHDLNNLLTVVLGNASLVAESLPVSHPGRNQMHELNKAGERAAHIVSQVLAYAGKGRIFNEVVDLSTLVSDFVKSLPPLPANIELSVDLDRHLPQLHGDRNQLLQLIGNLYLNAVEAIDERPGRIVISTYLQDCARDSAGTPVDIEPPAGACVCLSVRDTGSGIEESIRPRLFDPFFSTKFVGRGLGLPAAEGIMRAHNGTIRLSSEPRKGTTVTCLFSVAPAVEDRRM